ncbi:hypothetical protein TNCV_3654171 [Trichonephila clavipes]|nr:hypothetical protein TNCV_3654171 [Trichonephila clavipes]
MSPQLQGGNSTSVKYISPSTQQDSNARFDKNNTNLDYMATVATQTTRDEIITYAENPSELEKCIQMIETHAHTSACENCDNLWRIGFRVRRNIIRSEPDTAEERIFFDTHTRENALENHRDKLSATSGRPSISPSRRRLTSGHFPDVVPATEQKTKSNETVCAPIKEIPENDMFQETERDNELHIECEQLIAKSCRTENK